MRLRTLLEHSQNSPQLFRALAAAVLIMRRKSLTTAINLYEGQITPPETKQLEDAKTQIGFHSRQSWRRFRDLIKTGFMVRLVCCRLNRDIADSPIGEQNGLRWELLRAETRG